MATSESERKCELCLYPAHLQCKCVSAPVFVCPSCVLRHIRKDPEGTHRFFPLDEAMAEVERQRAKSKSKATVKPKVEETQSVPVRVVTQPREIKPALPDTAESKPNMQKPTPIATDNASKPTLPVVTESKTCVSKPSAVTESKANVSKPPLPVVPESKAYASKPTLPVVTESSASREDKEVTRVYTCPLCKAVLKNFLAYKGHMKQHVTE